MKAEQKAAWNLFLKMTPSKDWMDDEKSVQAVHSLMKVATNEPVKRRKKKEKKRLRGRMANDKKEQRTD
ncbi:hypothetical protein D920_00207 [Enterococcus faecalis 13-SD-W-01]|nr:hypothetical protein D920_00207 [Enterococcus faecalis 13-SD-W-01]